MTKIFVALAVVFLLAAAGEYYYFHRVVNGPYSNTTYAELRPRLTILERSYADLNQQKPSQEEYVRVESTKSFLRKDIDKLKKELLLRQLNVLLVMGGLLFFVLAVIRLIFGLVTRGRVTSRTDKGHRGHAQSGNVKTEAPRVEYIHEDDLKRKLAAGFAGAREAETWLTSDPFLTCTHCHVPVKAETIGSVHEVIYYEESPRGVPKDQLKKLGSAWVAKPLDRFTCHKCGRDLIRSAR